MWLYRFAFRSIFPSQLQFVTTWSWFTSSMDIPHGSAQFACKVDSSDLRKFCAYFVCSDKIKRKNELLLTDYYCVMSENVYLFRILVSSRCWDNPLTDSSNRETHNCTLNFLHLNGFAKCLCHCLKLEAYEWKLPSAKKGLTSFLGNFESLKSPTTYS